MFTFISTGRLGQHCIDKAFSQNVSNFTVLLIIPDQRGQCMLFSVVFTPSPPTTTAVFGSYLSALLLINTVPQARACLFIRWEMFRGTKNEDDRGPLSIQSSLAQIKNFWAKSDPE